MGPDQLLPIPRESEPVNDGNEGVLCIPHSFNISEALPSDCL